MRIEGAVALVTGANRGLGRHFARQLVERGAAKVYAAVRDPGKLDLDGVTPLRLDITDPASVRAAAEQARDVSILVNNAGIATGANLVTGDPDAIRAEMDTHFFGTLHMVRAFAPVLAANGGGAILNVLSVLSWLTYDGGTAYCAAKSAEWSLTNGIRLELAKQGTLVTGLHLGLTDTDMTSGMSGPKNDPADVARAGLDGIAAGQIEVLADDASRQVKAALSGDPAVLYPGVVRG